MQLPRHNSTEIAPAEMPHPRRVVCSVDADDANVLRVAAEMSKHWNAKLFLIHVVPEVHEGTLAYGFDKGVPLSEPSAYTFLEQLKLRAGGEEPVEAETIVQTGNRKKVLKKLARSLGADLIITNNRSRHEDGTQKKKGSQWNWILSALGFDPVSAGW